ncbi:MAG: GGDEF domain-containing protein [Deltaproteobacteria bacterium]
MFNDPIMTNGKKDPVTGFFAKEELLPFLDRARAAADGSGKPMAVFTFTLDQLRRSSRWDSTEDLMINFFASAMRLACPFKDEYAVFVSGSDKYVAVFPGKASAQLYRAGKSMERKMLKTPFVWNKWVHKLSFSGGICAFPGDGRDPQELLDNSERAMNTAIRLGRGRVCQFSQQWHESLKPYLIPIPVVLLALMFAVFLTYKPAHKPSQAKPVPVLMRK